jgi:hypothetical protein
LFGWPLFVIQTENQGVFKMDKNEKHKLIDGIRTRGIGYSQAATKKLKLKVLKELLDYVKSITKTAHEATKERHDLLKKGIRYTIKKSDEYSGFIGEYLDNDLRHAIDVNVDGDILELESRMKNNIERWDKNLKEKLDAIINEGHVNMNGSKLVDIILLSFGNEEFDKEDFFELKYKDGVNFRARYSSLKEDIAEQDYKSTPEYKEERRLAEEIFAMNEKRRKEDNAKQAAREAEIDAHVKSVVAKIDGLSAMAAGKLESTLKTKVNYGSLGILMRYEFIEKMVNADRKPHVYQVNKYKEPTRRQYNRMNNEEQRESERKIREGGTVKEYAVGDTVITKNEYDYANAFLGITI